jgi:hypothetical protein
VYIAGLMRFSDTGNQEEAAMHAFIVENAMIPGTSFTDADSADVAIDTFLMRYDAADVIGSFNYSKGFISNFISSCEGSNRFTSRRRPSLASQKSGSMTPSTC